jgi:hypothetical protein
MRNSLYQVALSSNKYHERKHFLLPDLFYANEIHASYVQCKLCTDKESMHTQRLHLLSVPHTSDLSVSHLFLFDMLAYIFGSILYLELGSHLSVCAMKEDLKAGA